MKTLRPLCPLWAALCVLCVSCLLSGCSTLPGQNIAQKTLTKVLPPDFKGDVDTYHKNMWFKFRVRAGNVHFIPGTPGFWTFTWFAYERTDKFETEGNIRLGPVPPPPETAGLAREYTRGYLDAINRTGSAAPVIP